MADIFVARPSMPELEEYIDEIKDLWETRRLTNMGDKHREFQGLLESYLKVPHIELLVNGHMALEMTLQAMELPEGSEVITTPFTFASTTHAIVRNGLTPVFCDIKEDDMTIDPEKIGSLITDRTSAILPVHVYGNICDVQAIGRIADEYGLKVVYDAAHTFGETYYDEGVGCFGDASIFSFHATKVFHSVEGGAVAYRDDALGAALYNLKNFGIRGPESVVSVGANAKMNELCAALGICNLRHIDDEIEIRKTVCERYTEQLADVNGVTVHRPQAHVRANYAYYPVRIDPEVYGEDRDALYMRLLEKGIRARKYFYPLTSDYECYREKFERGTTPVADKISRQVLKLPIYSGLEEQTIDMICGVIRNGR